MRRRFYILIAVAIAVAYTGLIEPNWLKVRTYDISVEGLARDLTVVHIADIHTKGNGYRETKVLEIIDRIDPDYVFLTGDILKSSSKLASGLSFLSGLTSRRGVFAVLGNGDGLLEKSLDEGKVPAAFGDWRILRNEHVDCGDFTVVGLDDPVTCRDNLDAAMQGVDSSRPVFVLTHFHAKKILSRLADMHAAIIFSGHTHGGQLGIGPLVSRIHYAHRSEYIAGLYRLNGTYLEVTRGVSTNIFPLRLFCRPEVAVFHLKAA